MPGTEFQEISLISNCQEEEAGLSWSKIHILNEALTDSVLRVCPIKSDATSCLTRIPSDDNIRPGTTLFGLAGPHMPRPDRFSRSRLLVLVTGRIASTELQLPVLPMPDSLK